MLCTRGKIHFRRRDNPIQPNDTKLYKLTKRDGNTLKRPSHGKLKLVCVNGAKTVGKHVLFVVNSLPTCLPTVFAPFTHTNLSLPTRVANFSLPCEGRLKVAQFSALVFWWTVITTLYHLVLRSCYDLPKTTLNYSFRGLQFNILL